MNPTLLFPLGRVALLFSLGFAVAAPSAQALAAPAPATCRPPAAQDAALPLWPIPHATAAELPGLLRRAEAGDVAAQLALGHYCMRHAEPGYANEQKAGSWFRRAAEAGAAEGQAWYAVWHWVMAETVSERRAKAGPWALRAAEQGHSLGAYLMGKLSEADDREARALIDKVARSGDPLALMMAAGHPHRSTKNTHQHRWEHPVQQSLLYSRMAMARAAELEWQWYGSLFSAYVGYGRAHGKGGAHYWALTQAYLDHRTLCSFAGLPQQADAVAPALVAALHQRANSEPVAANLALAELFRHWKTLYFHNLPCPGDYKEYAARAAAATTPGGELYDDARLRGIAREMVAEPRPAPPHVPRYQYTPTPCEDCEP